MTEECDGKERHRHYKINSGTYITHIHQHNQQPPGAHFNELHHHNVFEHLDYSLDHLNESAEDTGEIPRYANG